MSDNPEYIVTRGGREVMRGDGADILNAARQGRLLSNDLVYQSATSQWSFARSLSILRGFPIRDRAPIEGSTTTDTSMLETGRRLLNQRRRFRRILRALGVVVGLAAFTVILFLIPDAKRTNKKEDLKKILELDDRAMKIEGSGQGYSDSANKRKGSSNMDSKAVTVDGEHNADLETDDEGRKAALLLTPEERAELAGVAQPDGKSSNTATPTEGVDESTETDRSPSIEAPKLPEGLAEEIDDESDQPPVLIRPKLEQLKRDLESISTSSSGDAAELNDERKFQQLSEAAERLSRLQDGAEQATASEATTKELNGLIDSIREGLNAGCESLQAAKQCKLRVQHPEWSVATLSAIVRKDVILGMSMDQVEASIGQPEEKRVSGPQAVWCYDPNCEQRVEFTTNRVMVYKASVVKSDTSIEVEPGSSESESND